DVPLIRLGDEEAVAAAYLRHQLRKGPVETLVIANPADTEHGAMSALAPWVALEKRAPLLLTDSAGDNVDHLVRLALEHRGPPAGAPARAGPAPPRPRPKRPGPPTGRPPPPGGPSRSPPPRAACSTGPPASPC